MCIRDSKSGELVSQSRHYYGTASKEIVWSYFWDAQQKRLVSLCSGTDTSAPDYAGYYLCEMDVTSANTTMTRMIGNPGLFKEPSSYSGYHNPYPTINGFGSPAGARGYYCSFTLIPLQGAHLATNVAATRPLSASGNALFRRAEAEYGPALSHHAAHEDRTAPSGPQYWMATLDIDSGDVAALAPDVTPVVDLQYVA